MPTVDDLGKSKYLKQSDCINPIIVTIKGYEKVNMAMAGQPENLEWVLFFQEDVKPLVLKKTNGNRIAVIAGIKDFDVWVEKAVKIELYVDEMVEFQGNIVGGIRVRRPSGQVQQPSNEQPSIEEQRRRLAEAEKAEAEKAKASSDDTDEYGNPIPF